MLKLRSFIFYLLLNSFEGQLLDFNSEATSFSCKTNDKSLDCSNFNTLNDLQLTKYGKDFQELILKPSLPIVLSRLSSIRDSFFETDFIVKLSNFNGFDITDSIFFIDKKGKRLEISNSSFTFIYTNLTEYDCHLDDADYENVLFYRFKNIQLGSGMNYANSVCPIIFKQNTLESLEFIDLTDTNKFKFTDIEIPSGKSLDSTITKLVITNSDITLDANLLNGKVFEKLEHLTFSNKLKSINETIFRSFQKMKTVELNLDNMDEFLKEDDLLCNLIKSTSSNQANPIILILNDVQGKYDFSKNKICDSFNINSTKLVPIMVKNNVPDCAFTLKFLGLNKDWSNIDCNKLNLDCGYVQKINECIQNEKPTTTAEPQEKTTELTTLTTTLENSTLTTEKCDNGCKFELITTILIVFASIIFAGAMAVLILIFVYFFRKMKNNNNQKVKDKPFVREMMRPV